MKKFSLSKNLLYISMVVIIVSLGLSLFGLLMMRRNIEGEIINHNNTMVSVVNEQLKDHIVLPLEQIKHVDDLVDKGYDLDGTVVTDYFETIINARAYITDIHIMDRRSMNIINTAPFDETIIGTSVKYSKYDLNAEENTISWSTVHISNHTFRPAISASIVIDDYAIGIDIELTELPISLTDGTNMDEIRSIAIVDQWGTYIYSDSDEDIYERRQLPYYNELIDAYENQKKLKDVEFVRNDALGWFMIFDLDSRAMFKEVNNMTITVLLIWGVLSVSLIIFVLSNIKKIRKGLDELKNRTQHIINGDYLHEDYYFTYLEFEDLAKDFDVMSFEISKRQKRIEEINIGLERVVVERTNELQDLNAQLEEEIQEKGLVEEELRQINEELDEQVRMRTYDLRQSNEALKKNIEIAQKANEAKTHFLAVMSHEMRTPLNGIIGFLQMLELGELNETDRELVTIIKNSSNILLSIINDLLDVSKYDAGKVTFEKIRFDYNKVLRNLIAPYKALANEEGIQFELLVDGPEECYVKSDPTKITQLYTNIVNNALKFTSKGYIIVENRIVSIDNYYKITTRVKDSGIGILEDIIPKLFQPFTQAENSISREYGGTGLGLTICREIVEKLEGDIKVESEYGVGTTFEFTILLEKDHEDVLIQNDDMLLMNENNKYERILLVEDNKVNQKLILKFLEKYQVDCDVASNGQEAVEAFRSKPYDLVLMDCQMPVMDGFEATQKIRTLSPKVYIVAMTAYVTQEDKDKCLSSGMDKFLTKPVDLREVANIIGFEERYKSDLEPIYEENMTILDEKKYYAEKLVAQLGFDYETCYDLIDTYVSQAKQIFEDILTLERIEDYDGISKRVHQLKGASGAVRLNEISKLVVKSEDHLKKKENINALSIIYEIMKMSLFKE